MPNQDPSRVRLIWHRQRLRNINEAYRAYIIAVETEKMNWRWEEVEGIDYCFTHSQPKFKKLFEFKLTSSKKYSNFSLVMKNSTSKFKKYC